MTNEQLREALEAVLLRAAEENNVGVARIVREELRRLDQEEQEQAGGV